MERLPVKKSILSCIPVRYAQRNTNLDATLSEGVAKTDPWLLGPDNCGSTLHETLRLESPSASHWTT